MECTKIYSIYLGFRFLYSFFKKPVRQSETSNDIIPKSVHVQKVRTEVGSQGALGNASRRAREGLGKGLEKGSGSRSVREKKNGKK